MLFFGRPDGDVVREESPLRLMMPYAVRSRAAAAMYHTAVYDVSSTLQWLGRLRNEHRSLHPTLFHLVMWAAAITFHRHPRLNRFVMGNRLYQRRGVQLSFAAKTSVDDDGPFKLLKVEVPEGATFVDFVQRLQGKIESHRRGERQAQDGELALAMKLPGPLLALAVRLVGWADRMNLLPASMIEPDPMYATAFFTNLGSVGLDRTHHHLNEVGTASYFVSLGRVKRGVVVDEHGQPAVRPVLEVCWTADERVTDGSRAQRGLDMVRRIVEAPHELDPAIGSISAPAGAPAPAGSKRSSAPLSHATPSLSKAVP